MSHNPYVPPQANVDMQSDATRAPIDNISVHIDDLSQDDKWRFAWGFFWRSAVVAVLSMLGGGIVGAIIGFVTVLIAQAVGKSLADVLLLIRVLSGCGGLLVGFAAMWQLLRWCFRTRWFGYRLRLVKDAA